MKKLKHYGKRCFAIGKNIDKETKKFVDTMDKIIQDSFDENVITLQGLDFHLTTTSCPRQYEIYKDGKYVAYFRFRHGVIEVHSINDDIEDVEDKINWEIKLYHCGDFDLFQGEFDDEEQEMKYLNEVATEINKYLKGEKTKIEEEERARKERKGYLEKHPEEKEFVDFWAKALLNLILDSEQEDTNETNKRTK